MAVGQRTVVVTAGDDGYRTALALAAAGLQVPAVLDVRETAEGALPRRRARPGCASSPAPPWPASSGGRRVAAVLACDWRSGGGAILKVIACDAVAMAGGWSPAVHLFSHAGGRLDWDAAAAHFAPDPARPPRGADGRGFVLVAGAAAGALDPAACLEQAHQAGRQAAEETGFSPGDEPAPRAGLRPKRRRPRSG